MCCDPGLRRCVVLFVLVSEFGATVRTQCLRGERGRNMPWFTDGWKDIIDTVNSLVPQAYTNQKRIESIDDGTRLAETVFTLRPLSDGDGAAARATQRGVRLLRDGQHDSALREFHDAKQLSPSCHIAYFNLGCAHHMKGDDHTAISWYRDAHRLAPEDETATLAVVILESNRGQLDEATKMLTNFLRDVDASNINVLRQLAALHQREQRWSQVRPAASLCVLGGTVHLYFTRNISRKSVGAEHPMSSLRVLAVRDYCKVVFLKLDSRDTYAQMKLNYR